MLNLPKIIEAISQIDSALIDVAANDSVSVRQLQWARLQLGILGKHLASEVDNLGSITIEQICSDAIDNHLKTQTIEELPLAQFKDNDDQFEPR